MMQIENNTAVIFHYTLTIEEGETTEDFKEPQRVKYVHGHNQIIAGLEAALSGRKAGDSFKVIVPPQDAYGVRDEGLVEEFPIANFSHLEEIKEGMRLEAGNNEGRLNCTVTKIEGDKVTIDANHPFAGKTLQFDVQIDEVREVSPDELEALKQYK